ncbi:hypothetical protein MSHI_16430 [Mycobacterium shinjukuense]|uniref:Uncharacterized protein n=1 Tax=Mycobacterium shinjukuense TaxID=398694 RepID=A0A7I7MPM5_9MYCO|nr:hypothetical protein MSHI_16430 [Mycobacterium shinjukuense]
MFSDIISQAGEIRAVADYWRAATGADPNSPIHLSTPTPAGAQNLNPITTPGTAVSESNPTLDCLR